MHWSKSEHGGATARRWFGLLACLCLLLQQFVVPVHLAMVPHSSGSDADVGHVVPTGHPGAHHHGLGSLGHSHPGDVSAAGQHAGDDGADPTPPSHPAEDHEQEMVGALARPVPAIPGLPAMPVERLFLLPLLQASRPSAGVDRAPPDRPPPDSTSAPRAPPFTA